MRYELDNNKKESAYLQIYTQLREEITRGIYGYGVKMPSKRQLAEESGTSVITAEHVYALLCDEGYVEARERSGYFVIYREDDSFPVAGQRLQNSFPDGAEDERPLRPSGKDRAEGNPGSRPGTEQFPFSVFAKTMRRVLTNYAENIMERSPNNGIPQLRRAITAYLARSRGILVSPEQVVVGSGAEYLYGLVVRMLGRDRIYALEDPSYKNIRKVYEANGVTCDMLKLGENGIHSSELRRTEATVLHVTPFNSYPSGVTANASKRGEYVRWAKNRGAIIVEDDYDSEFSELTKAEDTLFSLEPTETVIYINTFSRTIASAMRMGYMVLPEKLADPFWKKIDFYSCAVPTFEQYVLTELLNNGDFERHINRVRRSRRKFPSGVKKSTQGAGQ